MILDSINAPADLRRLTQDELRQLAAEIREFIVNAVSVTGGHLGSNLGAVELTLALHRVFDSPKDIILWDTGHQAYVHKIVTGRRDQFVSLRQQGGLSGYPNRAESEHDWVENSHASTILGYAHGLATALDAKGEDRRVVAVIGDGSMTGGMAYEGLNNLGHSGRNVTVILNDNGRSYAPTVSHLSESLARIRVNPTYMRRQRRLEQFVRDLPAVGERAERLLEGAKAALREIFEPTAFFEALGVRYTGPFDGHDIAGVESALRNAAEFDGPTVVHVLTQKGRGYPPAEDDEEKCLHDTSVFDPVTGQVTKPSAPSYTSAFTDALVKLAEENHDIVAITAAMPGSTGLIPFQERFPDRFLDVGIAEQHAVTAAAGLAMGGMRPVVAIYSTFLTRAFDQVNLDVGLHGLPVVFAVDRAGITGDDGPSHHGVLDLVLLTKVPGMTVFAPSSAQELAVMLDDALDVTSGPCAIRWSKTPARLAAASDVGRGLRARRVTAGDDVCILAVGTMLEAAQAAVALLAADGVSASVWDVRVCKPLDPEMIEDAARHRIVLTVENGIREGGVGSAVADAVAARRGAPSPPVVVLGVPVAYIPHGKPDTILAGLGLDADGIARAAVDALTAAAIEPEHLTVD